MGMFDSILISYTCPYCVQNSTMDFQTKDLECFFNSYSPGDTVREEYRGLKSIQTIASCQSLECQARADKFNLTFQDVPSGFGALFEAKVVIEEGVITDKVTNVKTKKEYTDEEIEKCRSTWENKHKPRK